MNLKFLDSIQVLNLVYSISNWCALLIFVLPMNRNHDVSISVMAGFDARFYLMRQVEETSPVYTQKPPCLEPHKSGILCGTVAVFSLQRPNQVVQTTFGQ